MGNLKYLSIGDAENFIAEVLCAVKVPAADAK
jgi:hypothetical protein